MNPMNRATLAVALMSLTAMAVSTNAAAALDNDAVSAERVAVTADSHSCTKSGETYYCFGVHDECFAYWFDDDVNGDPYDGNARIQSITCA